MFDYRLMLKRLLRKHNAAKNKSDSEIVTLITSGNERGVNEEAVAGAEVIGEAIVISIGVLHEIQGLHLLDAEAHHLASVVLLPHVRLIHTFHLAEVAVVQMTGDAGRLLLEDRLPTRGPGLELHHVEDTKTTILQDHAVDILQANLGLLHDGLMAEIEVRGFGDVVMIEQDPTHLQIPLAHVPPDEKDAPLPCRLVVLHHLQEPDIMAEDGVRHLHRVLAQQAGTENLRADPENHFPMTVMTEGVALIIERDQDIIMTSIVAPAPAVATAKNDFLLLLHH